MLPAKIPVAKPKRASSLRLIVGLLPARPLRLRRLARRAPETALQVVEDEADGGRRAGRRRDAPPAVANDEDAAGVGRRLELGHLARVGAKGRSLLEQLRAGAREPVGRRRTRE